MKGAPCSSLLLLGALVLFIAAVSVDAQNNCWLKPEDCQEDECCIRVTNFVGMCKKLKEEGNSCATHPVKQPLKDHVFLVECPCAEGLTCVKREGLVGHVRGTCQEGQEGSPGETEE